MLYGSCLKREPGVFGTNFLLLTSMPHGLAACCTIVRIMSFSLARACRTSSSSISATTS
jgi:hypothetical protein